MKTGIIVYVLGNQPSEENFDEKKAVRDMDVKADRVELVFSGEKCFDLSDAWWKLTTKGMNRIVCRHGEIAGQSDIRLRDRELQLCAY